MINIEKRIMPWCEECENFEPNTICLSGRTVDGESIGKRIVVECVNADICSRAVHQYQKTCENTPIISDPSPCRDCNVIHKKSCCGCEEYVEWRKKNDR